MSIGRGDPRLPTPYSVPTTRLAAESAEENVTTARRDLLFLSTIFSFTYNNSSTSDRRRKTSSPVVPAPVPYILAGKINTMEGR